MVLRAGLQAGLLNQSSAQVIDGSLKFDRSSSQHLSRTFSLGNRRTWTWSGWIKKNTFGTTQSLLFSGDTYIQYYSLTDTLYTNLRSAATNYFINYANVYRDPSWYHVVVAVDTTQSTSSNRQKVYVNGVQLTDAGGLGLNYPPENENTAFNSAAVHYIGGTNYFDGAMSQVYFIDGQTLGPENFGFTDPLTNTWRPKKFDIRAEVAKNPNNGTTWDSTNTTAYDGGVQNDSVTGTSTFTGVNGNFTSTLSQSVEVRNHLRLQMYASTSAFDTYCDIQVNGSGEQTVTVHESQGSEAGIYDVNFTGTLSSIKVTAKGGANIGLAQVIVDDYVLINGAGNNSFYLPFDGNSPIGQDKSGNGNDWTPVNFGGSNSIEKATGALPILNTTPGGTQASVGVRTDAYASSLVLALPLVGSANDVSNQINSGSTTKTGTLTTASIVTTNSNFYSGSLNMGGGRYDITDSTDFNFGSGSYTLECWVYVTSGGTAGSGFIGKWYAGSQGTTNSYLFYRNTSGELHWIVSSDGTNGTSYNAGAIPLNKWTHCAVSYDSSSDILTTFIDGVCVKRVSSPASPATVSRSLTLGRWDIGDGTWSGQMSDVRIYKGVAKYTASAEGNQGFVPASSNPDILPDTPSGVSGSSKLTKPTKGAVTFDGSGDYLSVADNGDFTLSGDYTVECFFNMSVTSGNHAIFGLGPFAGGNNTKVLFRYESSGNFNYYIGGDNLRSRPIAKNSWYHLAVVRNSNVVKIFLNGTQVGADISHSATISGDVHVGSGNLGGSEYNTMTGFISNFRLIKDQALYTADFTPPTAPLTTTSQGATASNVKLLCCQSNSSATAYEVSPGTITANGNSAPTTFNPFTTDINTVRGQETGYCTLNPLDLEDFTLSNGNLNYSKTSTSWKSVRATQGVNSGKWYYEFQFGSDNRNYIGISQSSLDVGSYAGATSTSYSIYLYNGYKSNNASDSAYASAFASTDVLGVAFDLDASTITFYKNGISLGVAFTGVASGYYFPTFSTYLSGENGYVNFGQKPFKFPPPDGFLPLNAANVRPETVIARPDQYVDITTWSGSRSGSGGLTRHIDTGNQPDFVWIKQRNQAYSTGHQLYDSVRGAGAEKELNSSGTAIEGAGNIETYGWLDSFDKTGFTVKGGSTDYDYVDKSGVNYVAWTWKAGGNKNTFNVDDVGYASAAAAGLTAGTITPTGASVNTKSGFSIIRYTGGSNGASDSVPHGLGRTPGLILHKNLGATSNWNIKHSGFPSNYGAAFTQTQSQDVTTAYSGGGFADLTSDTTFGFLSGTANANNVNESGADYICYIWADVPGLQKFGLYAGNNTSAPNGPFVELGFRPALVMIKRSNGTGNWIVYDNKRDTFNPLNGRLYWNTNSQNVDNSGYDIDFLSNGFRITGGVNDNYNASSNYIYAAWAEAPSFNLYGGQSNAR